MKSDGWNWSEETAKLLDLSQLKLDAMSGQSRRPERATAGAKKIKLPPLPGRPVPPPE